jgi:hypothetical protein
MVWPVKTHPAQSTGPESKRNSGDGGYFSLDFSFYRTPLPETTVVGAHGRGPAIADQFGTIGIGLADSSCVDPRYG